ncbi:putative ABC transport system permease protein [Chitinophaga sp. YR573]|uniref:ABC transporter permease n=1 Tax=Chitinophaga sp. YR573 TaxID=1881040 RepID=UPI0008D5E51E|nr:ABC transporter permease [Chitinophaga sp. YR573]SEW13279.1 putative ABC transport system permease protein [Chitinophaga sp. YR573]
MISNYLRIGWRNIRRHKLYSGINIGGLALGLAVGILLLIWVQDELSFDRFHKNGASIYKLSVTFKSGTDVQTWGAMPAPIVPVAVKNIAGVEGGVRMNDAYDIGQYTYGNKDFYDVKAAYVDPGFFTMFSFPMLKGNPFSNNQSIVITRSAAKRYFGTEEAVGKVIQANKKDNYMVSGVMEDFPLNSSIHYDFLFPFDILTKNFTPGDHWKTLNDDWGDFYYSTYLQLAPGTRPDKVGQQLALLRPGSKYDTKVQYNVQPLYDVHLYNSDQSEGGIKIVRIFLIVAIVILLIACVNYVNLSTARAMQRAGEIGIRKMVGAARRQLFLQFLWESALVFVMALALAVLIMLVVIPFYNDLTDKHLSLSVNNMQMIIAIGMAMLLTLLVAGIYPAILLSSFDPLKTLKGRITLGRSNISFRKALVILQFVIATVLIISTLIVGQQLQYIRSKALGYDKENIFQFNLGDAEPHFSSVAQEMSAIAGIHGVAGATQDLLNIDNSTGDTHWDEETHDQSMIVHVAGINKAFLEVMNFKLVSGVNFTDSKADSGHYIVNETAAKMMGMKDAVGKRFKLWQNDGIIIGVVKDFHFASLHEKIAPLVFYYGGGTNVPTGYRMYVKTSGKDAQKAIDAAAKIYARYNGDHPFEYSFLDEGLDRIYRTDQRTGRLFNYFAFIAIFISCLGLFGLATFATTQRVKEIGIRKVLGASVTNIVTLLSSDFLKTVFIAILLSIPIAWLAMHKWLEDYAYRIGIDWKVFVMAGSLAVLIALFTVSFQAIKAALLNPVKSLKSE